jgi:hypothetical protein
MIFHNSVLKIREVHNFNLSEQALIRLEDGVRKKEELLVTIDASHFGMLNGNVVVYRHDTVKDNIGTFIHPAPKPIIENHRPKVSKRFGSIIAVDYKLTDYYNKFSAFNKLEDLTTEEYISMCNDLLIPHQRKDSKFNGLGYVETVGMLNDEEGIRRVLAKEFATVSIGADPKRLICSHCLQDQVADGICDHFHHRAGGFMLAEDLEYEELSFLRNKKAADPHGKITKIHDGIVEEIEYEVENLLIEMDFINKRDFFKLADETKTIVCCDNICKIVNREAIMARKAEDKKVTSLSYVNEFGDKLKEIKIQDAELTEEDQGKLTLEDDMKDSQFAIVQKTEDEIKRRFPLHDELNVKLAIELLDCAEDLTPAEVIKAQSSIGKAAKKLGIEANFEKEVKEEVKIADAEGTDQTVRSIDEVITELKTMVESLDPTKLTDDEGKSPVTRIFDMVIGLDSKFVGEALDASIGSYLSGKGQGVATTEQLSGLDNLVSLQDELQEAKEEVTLLDELNRDLNVQIRQSKVDEIIDLKQTLGLLTDSVEEERAKLLSHPYNVLVGQVSDFRQLKAKFKVQDVNNTKEDIKSVNDPTLQDALDDSDTSASSDIKIVDEQKEEKALSDAEIVSALRRAFSRV